MYASPQQPAQAPHPRAQLPEPGSLIEETFRQARFLGSDFTDTLRFCGAASYATTTQTVRVQPCQHRNAAGQARHAPRRRVRSRRAQRRRTLGRQRRCASQRSVKPPCAEQPAGPARPGPDRPRQRARPRAPLTLVVEQPPDPGEEDPHPRPAPAAAGSSAPAARGCPWPRPPQGPARRPACGRGPPRRACSRCALRAERPPRADIAAARAPPLRSSRRAFPQAAGRRPAPLRTTTRRAPRGHRRARGGGVAVPAKGGHAPRRPLENHAPCAAGARLQLSASPPFSVFLSAPQRLLMPLISSQCNLSATSVPHSAPQCLSAPLSVPQCLSAPRGAPRISAVPPHAWQCRL